MKMLAALLTLSALLTGNTRASDVSSVRLFRVRGVIIQDQTADGTEIRGVGDDYHPSGVSAANADGGVQGTDTDSTHRTEVSGDEKTADSSHTDTDGRPVSSVTGRKYEGSGTAVDYSESGAKEFYTIETSDDKVFYLVIDKDKTENNTYFLREINEDELEIKTVPTPAPVISEPAAVQTKAGGFSQPLTGLGILVALGAGYWIIRKKTVQTEPDPEDYNDEDDEDFDTPVIYDDSTLHFGDGGGV